MKLLTKANRKTLPQLYANADTPTDKVVAPVKFFTPDGRWTWYATEFDGRDTFFGLVDGQFKEFGYFRLSDLSSARGPLGLSIERDLHWKPKTMREIAPELFSSTKV